MLRVRGGAATLINARRSSARGQLTVVNLFTGTTFDVHLVALHPRSQQVAGFGAVVSGSGGVVAQSSLKPSVRPFAYLDSSLRIVIQWATTRLHAGGGKEKDALAGPCCQVCVSCGAWHLLLEGLTSTTQTKNA